MTEESAARTLVKICGIREESTVSGMAGLPVDMVGFVFAPSKRKVSPEQASRLAGLIRASGNGKAPRIVGVFVDPTWEELADTLAKVPLDVVQLHGRETPGFCREARQRFGVEVWRALSADDPDEGPERLARYADAVSTVLLDTGAGGTGRTFGWEVIPAYREEARKHGLRLFIAGGLTPENAGELVSSFAPDGVDISSGVETDGVKDIKKIAAFAERVNKR